MFRTEHYICKQTKESTTFFVENRWHKALNLIEHRDNWKELFDWLKDKKIAKIQPLDNAWYSDNDEDSYIGWMIIFDTKEDAVLFKLTWS
jgi:hypothetical protein